MLNLNVGELDTFIRKYCVALIKCSHLFNEGHSLSSAETWVIFGLIARQHLCKVGNEA